MERLPLGFVGGEMMINVLLNIGQVILGIVIFLAGLGAVACAMASKDEE